MTIEALQQQLISFATALAETKQPYGFANGYENDSVEIAVAQTKAEIGQALLCALKEDL